MPPGMGKIPYRTVIPLIKDYSGVATMEIRPRYKEFYPEALKMIKEIFEESQNRLRDKRRYRSGREVLKLLRRKTSSVYTFSQRNYSSSKG